MKTYTIYIFQIFKNKDGSNLDDYSLARILADDIDSAKKSLIKKMGSELRDRKFRLSEISDFPYDERFKK